MRLILLLAATLVCGCIDESDSEPKPAVRETGYVECVLSADCDGDLRCTTADGEAECADTGGAECLDDFCTCWAALFCAQGDACRPAEDGFSCVESVEQTLTQVSLLGVCPAPGADTQVEIGLLVGTSRRLNLTPADRVDGLNGSLGETLTADAFAFEALPDRDFMGAEPATAEGADQPAVGLTPAPQSLRFDAAVPPSERLLVLAVDHSGSLIGQDPDSGGIDINAASDIRDERIAFLRTLSLQLNRETYLSLVSFQEQLPRIDPMYATPTHNRDLIQNGLTELESGSTGTTPLTRALRDIRASIIAANADLRASVVLFTDGIEGGDPTDDGDRTGLDAEIAAYADADITVHVLQLRPPISSGNDQERDPKLVELACRTGGEYVFLEDPERFTDPASDLASSLAARQDGVWRLTVQMPGLADLAAGWWAIAARLTLQMGATPPQVDLRRNRNAERAFDDTRLWLRRD